MRAIACVVALAACSAPARRSGDVSNQATGGGAACPASIHGVVHDVVAGDQPVIGATVVIAAEAHDGEAAITDDAGGFTLTAPLAKSRISVYYDNATFEADLPACPGELWLGIKLDGGIGGEVMPLIIR